jgi:NAD+ kinase
MRVGILLHHERAAALAIGTEFVERATERGLDIVARTHDAERLGIESAVLTEETLDAIVAVGGDGTVLEASRIGRSIDAPVLGINAGRVGFLADVEADGIGGAVDALASGAWRERVVMTVRAGFADGTSDVGLNDVVMEKVASRRLVSISLSVDGADVVTYHADGVVVCTPTGSTAYNLSAGGPLLDRRLEALTVTPVAPHSLFAKSLVFSGQTRLRCTVTNDRPVGVAVDGRELGQLEPGEHVDIWKGESPARLIDVSGHSFDQLIRRKFGLE